MIATFGKRLAIAGALIVGLVAVAAVAGGEVVKLEAIALDNTATSSTYKIQHSGNADYQEYLLTNPPRLVVDLLGVTNSMGVASVKGDGKNVTLVRTSQFKGAPDLITRVVFDMKKDAKYKVRRNGDNIEVTFFGDTPEVMGASFGNAWEAPVADPNPVAAPDVAKTTPTVTETPTSPVQQPAASSWQPQSGSSDAIASRQNTKPEVGTVPMEVALAQRKYFGLDDAGSVGDTNDPITIDVQGADIKTVLRSIAEFSGANIIAGPEVEGAVTIHLVEVPWQEALFTILKANGYDYRDEYGMIRVSSAFQLQEEEVKEVVATRKKEELGSLVSEVVRLNFANAKEMQNAMNKVVTKRGSISIEKGSNAVIINDVQSNVDRIAKMVVDLDRKVSQVEIIAKMVDVDYEATRELGIKWGLHNLMPPEGNFAADAVVGQSLTDPFGAVRLGTVQSWGNIDAAVEALEKENKANIVSNPRIVTADNKEASILVGKEIPLIVSDEAGNPITELKKVGVLLRVTPHVNSDRTITLEVHPEVSELSSQATVQGGVIISLESADTRVVVNDGETTVIGGLINEVESSIERGIPMLKDLPLMGQLFRFNSKTNKKRELIIFITPKIIGE